MTPVVTAATKQTIKMPSKKSNPACPMIIVTMPSVSRSTIGTMTRYTSSWTLRR